MPVRQALPVKLIMSPVLSVEQMNLIVNLGDLVDGRERNGDDGVYSKDFDPDTFRLSESISEDYAGYGDNEVRMRKSETEDLSGMYHEELDWANPGCQHKNKFEYRVK